MMTIYDDDGFDGDNDDDNDDESDDDDDDDLSVLMFPTIDL